MSSRRSTADRARGRRPLTVRERIVAAVLLLASLALLAAGGTAWVLQRHLVDEEIDATLQRVVTEMRTVADQGIDPRTGAPVTDAAALVYTMMEDRVPGSNEGMVAFVGDELRYRTQDIGVPLATDPQLVAALAPTAAQGSGTLGSITTDEREYRYAALPVRVGETSGSFVIAIDRDALQSTLNDTFRTYSLVALGAILVLAVGSWRLAGRLLLPLRSLRGTAAQISETDLSRRIPVTGTDDISSLALTFNAMLDRLEATFSSQRRLLDDAGHELRTPLTIVRGHLELMDPTDPGDAAETRELAMSELDRMHRLTDDLVLLAKAEAPDFVQPAGCELGPLMDNVLDQARRLGQRRWRLEPRLEASVHIDAQRTTQALLQLAANAVQFSAPGSTITFGSDLGPHEVQLWVADEGRGVPPDELDRIFDRFARVPRPGERPEGTGLGLSIVAAIIAGHGGHVSVESRPGSGSRFILHLPDPQARRHDAPEDEPTVPPDDPGDATTAAPPDQPVVGDDERRGEEQTWRRS